ncbi:MAG TPA: methyltransferase domain-containing protein, partial [Myxococcaceae bacterium]
MHPTFRRLGPSELLPRYIFAESLVARRRVLEVDAVASTGGESARFLLERGARVVVACDSDLAAVEAAQKAHGGPALRFRANVYDDLEPGSFDLVLVADLAPYVRAPALLAELARLVAKQGFLLGGLRNSGGLALWQLMEVEEGVPPTYGQLLDALSPHFPHVEVATQSPLLGYQLAFEKGEGLQVDGSLIRGSEAAYFMVVAGQEPARVVDPTWVQLPPEPLAFTRGRLEEVAQRAKGWEERTAKQKEIVSKLRAELADREAEVASLKPSLELAREDVARLTAQLEQARGTPEATRERDELVAKLRRRELELQVAQERLGDAERRLTQQRLEMEGVQRLQSEASVQVLAAHEAQRLERARREEVAAALEETRERLTQAYANVRDLQDELSNLRIDREKDRLAADRALEQGEDRRRQAEAARERELRIAEQYSQALAAVEHLKADLAKAGEASRVASDALLVKEAELARTARILEESRQRVASAEAGRQEAEGRLARREEELRALETELEAARTNAARLTEALAALEKAEEAARATAEKLEESLLEARGRMADLEEDREKAAATFAQALEAERELGEQRLAQATEEERRKTEAVSAQLARETAAREAVELQLQEVQAQARTEAAARTEASVALAQAEQRIQDLQKACDALGQELAAETAEIKAAEKKLEAEEQRR